MSILLIELNCNGVLFSCVEPVYTVTMSLVIDINISHAINVTVGQAFSL